MNKIEEFKEKIKERKCKQRKMKAKESKKNEGKRIKKEPINAKMSFAAVLQKYPESAEVFFKHGMSCFGCPAAMMENIEEGIKAHGKDVKEIVDELNKVVKREKR